MTFADIVSQLFVTVGPLVATVLAAYITKILLPGVKAWSEKAGLELSSRQTAYIEYVVQQAVLMAEERVEAAYKGKAIDKAQKAEEKMEAALSRILDKLPGVEEEEARVLADAALRQLGMGATIGVQVLEGKLKGSPSKKR